LLVWLAIHGRTEVIPRNPLFSCQVPLAYIVRRGHNRELVLFDDGGYQAYLGRLKELLASIYGTSGFMFY